MSNSMKTDYTRRFKQNFFHFQKSAEIETLRRV